MAKGNKFNNGVWEQGTPEIVLAYQHDTPGQKVEEYVEGLQLQNEKKKEEKKKHFTQVFDNPLKGFPYNEEFEVKEIKEENLSEVKQQEVDALKKLSKEMQAVLKGYQKIAGMGDKELKNTKYNKDYEAVLKSRDTILQLIGKVNTQKILNKEEVVSELEEDYKKVIKMFPRDNDWKKLITKHRRAIDDFRNNNKDLPSKVEDELLTWASQTGEVSGKHDAEDFILDILDENLDEVSQSAMIQKAIDIALSMGGNMTGAVKRIEKIKRGLSKNKNVANALRLANETYLPKINVAFKEETVSENYRIAARHGMGTEGKKEARVGLELDYYDKTGAKYMGKIVKKDSKGYTVKDDKTGKMHTFVYHDRVKAKKFLQKMGDNLGEGAFSVKLDKPYKRGDEKMYMDIIKKYGGKNLKFSPPKRNDPELDIFFDGGDVKKITSNLPNKGKGSEWISEGDKSLAQQAAIAISKKQKEKNESVMNTYRNVWEETLNEEMITYRVKGMQKPEEDKFKRSAKMMGLKITMDKGKKDTVIVMSGTKKKLRDFDSIARGKSSYGDPSTITHFDEK